MPVEFKDYYKILGVDRTATQKDIQKAFRRLARQCHPDVSKDKGATEKFKEINEAYEVLKDPEKRRLYDSLGPNWKAGQQFRPPPGFEGVQFDFGGGGPRPGGMGGGAFSDFFEMLFGGGLGGFGRQRRSAGPSGFSGFQNFSGFDGDPFGGRGRHTGHRPRPRDSEAEVTVTLDDVYHGATKTLTLQSPTGQRTYDVTIPPGITDGAKIRLSNQGDEGGHLLLKVKIASHPTFSVQKHDLTVEVPVTPWEAVLGAKVEVPTLDGPVKLTVPSGAQSGTRLRLKDKGLPVRGGGRGNLYVVVKVVVPPNPTSEELELFSRLAAVSSFDPRS